MLRHPSETTPETPLTQGISEIPDYLQALEFAESLQAIGGRKNHDALTHGSSSIASTSPATTAMSELQQQQQQALYAENGLGGIAKGRINKETLQTEPRRTQLLPQTAPKSVDRKWKTRSQRKKHAGQKKKTKGAIDSAVKATFPPTAFGTDGQGAKLRQYAETNAKYKSSNFPFDQSGNLNVEDTNNFGVKKKKKKKREETYRDQIGIKLSWSAWMNKREDEKFHKRTIERATSHVGKDINDHCTRLKKLKQIFDPTKITALTRKFEQATIDRENRGLIDRLEKVAKAKTIISKTNDPKERRYVKKVARDKMRMLRQSKQHAINELNFENKLLLDLLTRSRSSIPSKKQCAKHFQRHKDQRKNMAKVFSPKSVQIAKNKRKRRRQEARLKRKQMQEMRKQGIDVRDHPLYGTIDPISGQLPPIIHRAMQEQEQQQKHLQQETHQKYHQRQDRHLHHHQQQQHQQQQQQQQQQQLQQQQQQHSIHDGGTDFSTIKEDQVVDEQKYLEDHALHSGSWRAVLPNPNVMSRGNDRISSSGMGRRSSRESLQSRGNLSTGGSMNSMMSDNTRRRRNSNNSTAETMSSVTSGLTSRGSSIVGGNGLGPIEGAFEKRRMLMEPKDMSISTTSNGERHVVTVSAFRGVHDRLVYEISDPMTGIVQYYDIPATLILEVGKNHPILLETKQTKRVEKLCYLLDLDNYFGELTNVVAKMFWWQGRQEEGFNNTGM